ncbi:replication protein A 70 kDa DNA-binding subunit B [Tanacetum coccineum]
MVNQSFLISNINTVKDTFSINAKVVRMWRQYTMGLRTSATIDNKMVSQFKSLLKEGRSVNLSNFNVVKNNAPYKVANHPFKINFHKKIKVKAIQSVFSSKYGLSFVPLLNLLKTMLRKNKL